MDTIKKEYSIETYEKFIQNGIIILFIEIKCFQNFLKIEISKFENVDVIILKKLSPMNILRISFRKLKKMYTERYIRHRITNNFFNFYIPTYVNT